MKQADEAIDRVLTGLRESEAPVGMENRILQAMQAHATGESAKRFVWWSWPRTAGYGALLAGLLVVVAVSVPHRAHQAVQEPGVRKRVEAEPVVTAEKATSVVEAAVPLRVQKPLLVRAEKVHAGQKDVQDSNAAEDELAREEMLAPSKPAPPLPMTAQEKSLIQAVRWHDPDELAMLNPEEQEKLEAKDEASFKAFFGILDAAKPESQNGTGAKDAPSDTKPLEPEAQGTELVGK